MRIRAEREGEKDPVLSHIKMISTSEIKISCIINRDDADKAVSAIHDMLFD